MRRFMKPVTSGSGTDEMTIVVIGSSDVKAVARDVLVKAISNVGSEIVDEASRYEAARNRKFTAEIHYSPSDIGQAEAVVRNRGFVAKTRGAAYAWFRIAQWILTLTAGLMGGLIPVWSGFGYLLAVSVTMALAITAYLEYSDWEESRGSRKN